MFKRTLAKKIRHLARKFPVVAILGPRQSGKTTLTRLVFPNHTYVSCEDLDIRRFAQEDPRKFLREFTNEYGLILDEVQRVPDLLSYIQTIVDAEKQPGVFILTGSQNLLLNEAISQTLPGRLALCTLLPLSLEELEQNKLLTDDYESVILKGSYPRIYSSDLSPNEMYPAYIRLYLEREVSQITQVGNLDTFERFMGLCAGRIGQILNVASLAKDCGISVPTVKSWLSILKATYILYFVQPYYKQYNRRVVKSPKLYFYDTGVACSLLRIKTPDQLTTHYARGNLFECLMMSEFNKQYYNAGEYPGIYYWRDAQGNEIDCVLEDGSLVTPIEIKSGETIHSAFFSELDFWNKLTKSDPEKGFLVYGGSQTQHRSRGTVVSWKNLKPIFEGHILRDDT